MGTLKELHLAVNINDLDIIANIKEDIKLKRLDSLCKAADRIYESSLAHINDEEMRYIFLTRYIKLVNRIGDLQKDRAFTRSRFGKKLQNAEIDREKLRTSLERRYSFLNLSVAKKSIDEVKTKAKLAVKIEDILFKGTFVTAQELFVGFHKNPEDIIVWDTRRQEEYEDSHLKEIKNVNIPETCIVPGYSANVLGKCLPEKSKVEWEQRNKYKYLILMDWKTTEESFGSSILHVLYSIVTKWDVNTNYIQKPYVLNGGYLSWIDLYPTFSTNSQIQYDQDYGDLDELLNLDSIEYPNDFGGGKVEKVPENPAGLGSYGIEANYDYDKSLDDFKESDKGVSYENNIDSTNENKTNDFENKSLCESTPEDSSKIIVREESSNDLEKETSVEKPENTETRPKDLKDFKALGGDQSFNTPTGDIQRIPTINRNLKPILKPKIDRNTKPKFTVKEVLTDKNGKLMYGLTGLDNIRNTCYQNALVQCLRHIPSVIIFVCKGFYQQFLGNKKTSILQELSELIFSLWCNLEKSVYPGKFYDKVREIDPLYAAGTHEDILQFFFAIFEALHEDCSIQIKDDNAAPATRAWNKQLNWTKSFFSDQFYHQLKVQQICSQCRKNVIKFEMENVLMLSIPEKHNKAFHLSDLLEYYLNENSEDFICKHCKGRISVKRSFSRYPRVAMVSVKRYYLQGNEYVRNNNLCHFYEKFRIGDYNYQLRGIALHSGTMNAGHYTAVCLNPIDNRWYEYNDSSVYVADINSNAIKTKSYVFFYTIIDGNVNAVDY